MAEVIKSRSLENQLLALAINATIPAGAGPLSGADVRLFKTNVNITIDTVWANLTECDFDGYALKPVAAWSGPTQDAAGQEIVESGLANFACSGTVTPNTVYGVAITTTGATPTLLASAKLDNPVTPFNGQTIGYVVRIGVSGTILLVEIY